MSRYFVSASFLTEDFSPDGCFIQKRGKNRLNQNPADNQSVAMHIGRNKDKDSTFYQA